MKQSFIWFPVHQTYWPEQMAVIFTAHTDCVSLVRFHCKHGRWACVLASCHVCAVVMIGKLYCENEELKQNWLQSAWFSRTNIRSNKKYHFQTIQIICLWIPLLKPDLLDAMHITDPLISSSAHSFTLSQLICRQSWALKNWRWSSICVYCKTINYLTSHIFFDLTAYNYNRTISTEHILTMHLDDSRFVKVFLI